MLLLSLLDGGRRVQRKQDIVSTEVAQHVDDYLEKLFVPSDAALAGAIASMAAADMPAIQVSACQGKFLYLLARMTGARRILELGTLAGYSTIWLGRALPAGGKLISLEVNADYSRVARQNLGRAALAGCVEVRTGPAMDSLDEMVRFGQEPFDMVFIDADKLNYPQYLRRVMQLTRPGSLIVADNIVRRGDILDPVAGDDSARGARTFLQALAAETGVEAVAIQTLGTKGYDGMALAIVR
jgi:predicted O-methyltransferase YrrM